LVQVSSSTDVIKGNVCIQKRYANFGIRGKWLTASCCGCLLLQKVTAMQIGTNESG